MIPKNELQAEFRHNFHFDYPLEHELNELLSLVYHRGLKVRKYYYNDNFEKHPFTKYISYRRYWSQHLDDNRQDVEFFISGVSHKYHKLLCSGYRFIPNYLYGYDRRRTDIALVSPSSDAVIAAEFGCTEIRKIIDCLMCVEELQSIWHFPYMDIELICAESPTYYYYVWSKGKDYQNIFERWLKEKQEECFRASERIRRLNPFCRD